jgi:phosphoglycerate dehydrogenase-like enzyme
MNLESDPGKPSVLVLHDRPDDFRDLLRARFPDLAIAYATTPEEVAPALEEARPEVVFSIKQPDFPGSTHRPAVDFASVRWFQVGGSGFEHIVPWDGGRLTVTNCAGVLSRFLAETVTGAMLMLNGGFPRYLRQQAEALWAPHPFRPISDQTLLVVGLGEIGGQVAANAKALGMRVLGIRRRQEPHPAVDELLPPDALFDALARADVVSLHLRLGEETRGLFGRRAFAAMRPGALFINTARGPIVEEAALVEALRSGHLGGAYLDVFETEPLPPESPLWGFETAVLTPHASDNVTDWPRIFAAFFADNLDRWRAGEPLRNRVEI